MVGVVDKLDVVGEGASGRRAGGAEGENCCIGGACVRNRGWVRSGGRSDP